MTTRDYQSLLMELRPRPIRSDAEYRRRLAQIEQLMRPDPSADVSAMIELLALIIEAWEAQHYPIPEAAPEEMLNHLIEARGLRPAEVALQLGIAPSTLSNYRSGKRRIPLERVKQVADYFSVSPTVFLGRPDGASSWAAEEDDEPAPAPVSSKKQSKASQPSAARKKPRGR